MLDFDTFLTELYMVGEKFRGQTLALPDKNHLHRWPHAWRRLHAVLHQIIETVNDKPHDTFRLDTE